MSPHKRRMRSFKMTRARTLLKRWVYSGAVSMYWGQYRRSITLYVTSSDVAKVGAHLSRTRDLTASLAVGRR